MRCFIAIQIPEAAKKGLIEGQKSLESIASGFYSWTDPKEMHLTLYFLGEIEDEQLHQIKLSLSEISLEPFECTLSGLVLLPEKTVPRILAAGFGGDKLPLKRLQQRVADTVFPIAEFKETRAFFPHITFGRLNRGMPGNAKVLKKALAGLKVNTSQPFTVSSFELVKSTLTKDGPIYETIESFCLR